MKILWLVKWNAVFHYYQDKRPEFDKAFEREREREREREESNGPPPLSYWPPTTIKPPKSLRVFFFFLNHGFKSFIWHMHMNLLTPSINDALSIRGRQWESLAYFHFMVCNLWTQHKFLDFHGPITLLHLFLVSWF